LDETHVSETSAGVPSGEYWATQQTHDDLIAAINAAQAVLDQANDGEQGSLTIHLYDDSGKPVDEAEMDLFVNLTRTVHKTENGIFVIADIPDGSRVQFDIFSEHGDFYSPAIYPFSFEEDGFQSVTLSIKPPIEYHFSRDTVIEYPGEWDEELAKMPIEFPIEEDDFSAAALVIEHIKFSDEWFEIIEDTPPADPLAEQDGERKRYTSEGLIYFENDNDTYSFGSASVLLETYNLTPHVSYIYVPIQSNIQWSVSVSSSAASWLFANDIRAFPPHVNGSFYIDVDANLGNASRTGTVTINFINGETYHFVINQAPGNGLLLSAETWNPSFGGEGGIFIVHSNRQWNVSIPSWLLLDSFFPANRTNDGWFAIEATPNFGSTQRTGEITVSTAAGSPATTRRIAVTQGTGAVLISPVGALPMPEYAVTSQAFQVQSNRMWTATSTTPSWLTVTPTINAGGGLFHGSFRISTTSANIGSTTRTGTIRIAAPGAPNRDIVVTQAAGNGLVLGGDEWRISANPAVGNVAVFSNRAWTAGTLASWLSVTPVSGNGNGLIEIKAEPNFGIPRAGTIVVAAGTTTRTVMVVQNSGSILWLSGTLGEPCPAASIGYVDIISNRTWSAVSSNTSWLTARRINNNLLEITTTEYTNPMPRTGTITVTTQGTDVQTETVRISQRGRLYPLTLSINTWNPPSSGSVTSARVTTNATWSVTSSDMSWLTVNRVSPDTFTISATRNTGNARNAEIYVTAPGAPSRKIIVRQAAASILGVSTDSVILTSDASNTTIDITSNTAWTVSSNAGWLRLNRTSGTGNGSFTISVDRNRDPDTKQGEITVTGGGITWTIEVMQLATPNNILDKVNSAILSGTGNASLAALQQTMIHYQNAWASLQGVPFNTLSSIERTKNSNIPGMNSISGFINGQGLDPQDKLTVGMNGTGADNGCGPISVYNAFHSLSQIGAASAPNLPDIIHRLNIAGGYVLMGKFGTNPYTMLNVIRDMGVNANIQYMTRTPNINLDSAILQSRNRTAILMYYGRASGYWHYVTIRHHGGQFEIYNYGSRNPVEEKASSVDAWILQRPQHGTQQTVDYLPLSLITFP
jgi:hypothetical protein